MSDMAQIPSDNEGWFKRHVIESLAELKQDNREQAQAKREMHLENQRLMKDLALTISEHEQADQQMFSSIQNDLLKLQPMGKIVYGTVALILTAVMVAIIALVVTKH